MGKCVCVHRHTHTSPNWPKLKKGRHKQSQEQALLFPWNQGQCSQWIWCGRSNSQFRILMSHFMTTARKWAKTSPSTLAIKNWYLHHANAPPHTSSITRDFFYRKQCPVVLNPSYSPDLGPCAFSLFPRLSMTSFWYNWRDRGRIADGAEHDFKDALKRGRSSGNGAYAQKGTTSQVIVASRVKVSFLPICRNSPGNYW
jgi:hypothetical protein